MSDYIRAESHLDAQKKMMVFDSEGYIVGGSETWEDIYMSAEVEYNGGVVGIAPRIYDTNMYMYLHIRNESSEEAETVGVAHLGMQIAYQTSTLDEKTIPPLEVGRTYLFEAYINKTNYRIYLNGKIIFNIEYAGVSKGSVGVFGTPGNALKSMSVRSMFPDGWTTNASSITGAVATLERFSNMDKYFRLKQEGLEPLEFKQTLTDLVGGPQSISFNAEGKGSLKVKESTGKIHQFEIDAVEWGRQGFPMVFNDKTSSAEITFSTKEGELLLNDVQLEPKPFISQYIHNDNTESKAIRGRSVITYPEKENIRMDRGTLMMWVSPSHIMNATTPEKVIFSAGEERIKLYYSTGKLIFQYGEVLVEIETVIPANEWSNVYAVWGQQGITVGIGSTHVYKEGTFPAPKAGKLIRIGHKIQGDVFSAAIDETVVLSVSLTIPEILDQQARADSVEHSSMIMKATFNNAIGNFDRSIVEVAGIPEYGSPVLIEKADGEMMRKVSFFDIKTGEYRTYNTEAVLFDSDKEYLELSYTDKEIDLETFSIQVRDNQGVRWGDPHTLIANRLHLTIDDGEREHIDGQHFHGELTRKALEGKYLYVTYQLKDSYTVDFNIGVPDAFRVSMGDHDGTDVTVAYEGNRHTDDKLITMVDLNPMMNPNHQGFLYITKNVEKVTTFRASASPETLAANGATNSLVSIEPLDGNGNYIGHLSLEVSAERGVVVPVYDRNSVKLRDMAGRYLYRYYAPILSIEQTGKLEVRDSINVMDTETGIGVQLPIRLKSMTTIMHKKKKGDTLQSIADSYGANALDIAYIESTMEELRKTGIEDNMLGDQVFQAAKKYVQNAAIGKMIEVPINHSSRNLREGTLELEHERMTGRLAEQVIFYMDMHSSDIPKGIGPVIDFNNDGLITMDEIDWLNDPDNYERIDQVHDELSKIIQ